MTTDGKVRGVTRAVAQGRFLVEAAAVQRAATRGLLTRIRFTPDEQSVTVVAETPENTRTARLPVSADRDEIASAVLPHEPPPGQGDAEGFPVTSPPRAVYAEILRDLGVNSDALTGYLGGGLHYVEVFSDGRTSATVRVADADGTESTEQLSLEPDEPVVGLPYTLVESARERSG